MPEAWHWALIVGCLALAGGLTGAVRRHASRAGVMDIPNARSSHSQPTPRGGGIAIVVTVFIAAVSLWLIDGGVSEPVVISLFGAGGLVAAVGYLDDRAGLSASVRFGAHLAATVAAVLLLGYQAVAGAVLPGLPQVASLVLIVFGAVWALNLFNFMDGIDGIAASESAFMAGAAALLIAAKGSPGALHVLLAAVSAASIGFLAWNWAPARIFMGDVGSGFLGFALALLALATVVEGALSIWTWLVLSSLFFADATVTLLRRVLRGERWYAAHRCHAYQHLTRRWGSHRRVTLLFIQINLLVLLPLAVWSDVRPAAAPSIAAATLAAFGLLGLAAGSGRAETGAEFES